MENKIKTKKIKISNGMKTISQIYAEYKIMPNLAEHMLRVASVASLICDNFVLSTKKDEIISACLLHDMGNIIKFDLDKFPEFLQPEGLDYWKKVQQEYFEKYGEDEHEATLKIADEIGVSRLTLDLIGAIGFFNAHNTAESDDYNKKITAYCDDRVSPFGIVSLEERLQDLRERYAHKGGDTKERRAFEAGLRKIEPQVFEKCRIRPEEINDNTVKPIISMLRDFVVK